MRVLEVLTKSKNPKPLMVVCKDGSTAGPGCRVAEDALLGDDGMFDVLIAEEPPRVRDVSPKEKKGGKK